jgi:quercetin dioxygenase-like cupin family protein
MVLSRLARPATLLLLAALPACADGSAAPTAVSDNGVDHMMHGAASVVPASTPDPFTFRAPLEPYRIHQLPDFLMQSKTRTDVVMQRLTFNPGAGMWHTHPGPSFIYVIQGQIRLDRYNAKNGCFQTPVHQPGTAYSEVADEVHRAVVVSSEPAVVLVTRFNIPIGSPITIPASDPGC